MRGPAMLTDAREAQLADVSPTLKGRRALIHKGFAADVEEPYR